MDPKWTQNWAKIVHKITHFLHKITHFFYLNFDTFLTPFFMTRLKTPVGIWHTPPDHDMCVNTLSQKSVIFVFLCTHQNAKCWNLGNAFLAQSALFWEPVLSTFDPLLSHYVVYTYRKPWSTSIYMPTPIVPKTYSGFDQNLRRVLAKNRPKSGSLWFWLTLPIVAWFCKKHTLCAHLGHRFDTNKFNFFHHFQNHVKNTGGNMRDIDRGVTLG